MSEEFKPEIRNASIWSTDAAAAYNTARNLPAKIPAGVQSLQFCLPCTRTLYSFSAAENALQFVAATKCDDIRQTG